MTSELRHAVEVWRDAYDAFTDFYHHTTEKDPARVIEADREAVRAEQAAEVERLTQCLAKANASMEEYERKFYLADDELAKFKALAETLAGALEKIATSKYDGLEVHRVSARQCHRIAAEALRQYKEARDER